MSQRWSEHEMQGKKASPDNIHWMPKQPSDELTAGSWLSTGLTGGVPPCVRRWLAGSSGKASGERRLLVCSCGAALSFAVTRHSALEQNGQLPPGFHQRLAGAPYLPGPPSRSYSFSTYSLNMLEVEEEEEVVVEVEEEKVEVEEEVVEDAVEEKQEEVEMEIEQ
ncbi:unnamed protein product [Lota lota]